MSFHFFAALQIPNTKFWCISALSSDAKLLDETEHNRYFLRFIRNGRNYICFRINFKTFWHYFYFVKMAHPNDRTCRNAFKKFRFFDQYEDWLSVLSFYAFFKLFPPKKWVREAALRNEFQHRNTSFEKRFFYQMSMFCIYRTWPSERNTPTGFCLKFLLKVY